MASRQSFQSSSHSGFLPPVNMVEKGRWAWHEPSGQLIFQKRRMSRKKSRPWLSSALLDFKQEMKEMKTKAASLAKERVEERTITLNDIKGVAVGLISEDLVRKMKKRTATIFDECCRTELMDCFLWATLMYFEAYLEHDKAKSDENVYIPGSLGKRAREKLRKCECDLRQRQTNLGHVYMSFVLGLGHRNSHHTKAGRSKVSKTHTDRHLFETIYEFTMYTVWITFGYEHWKSIQDEIGRILRSSAFNKDVKESECEDDFSIELEGLGTIYKDSDEYISYRVYYDRPAVGSLRKLRSPLMVNYFPSSSEKSLWAFQSPYKPLKKQKVSVLPVHESPPQKFGIIGQPLSDYDPKTLQYIERSDSEGESDSEDSESDVCEDDSGSGLIDINDILEDI